MRYLISISLLSLILILKLNPLAYAESLAVSLRVGDTRISFEGHSSPSAFITIQQNSAVIGTTVADSVGYFTKTVDADNPGIQSFELFSTDTNSLVTPTITYNVNLAPNTLTTIGNIVMPPTITINNTTNTISGMTSPLAELNLFHSHGGNDTILVSIDGTWTHTVTYTTGGTYTAYAIATMPGNYMSLASETVTYTIVSATTSPSSTPTSSSANPSSTTSPSTTSSSPTTSPKPSVSAALKQDNQTSAATKEPVSISTLTTTIAKSLATKENIAKTVGALSITSLILNFPFFAHKYKKSRTKKDKKKAK